MWAGGHELSSLPFCHAVGGRSPLGDLGEHCVRPLVEVVKVHEDETFAREVFEPSLDRLDVLAHPVKRRQLRRVNSQSLVL